MREALFYYWKKQLQEVGRSQFVEVQVGKPDVSQRGCGVALGTTIEVRLRNGHSLMVAPEFNAGHLRALLAVLESES